MNLLLAVLAGMLVIGLIFYWKRSVAVIGKQATEGAVTGTSSGTGTINTGTGTGKQPGSGAGAGTGTQTGSGAGAGTGTGTGIGKVTTTVTTTAAPVAANTMSPFRPLPKETVKSGAQAADSCEHVINGGVCNDSIANGRCSFEMQQRDGNVVFYQGTLPDAVVKYSGNSDGRGTPPYELIMQWDGNLVAYDKTGRDVWASNTSKVGIPPHRAVMLDTCEFVIYDSRNVKIWSK